MSIVVRNINKKYALNEKLIKNIAAAILKILNKPQSTELEVIFLSDAAIRPINKKFKHRDAYTDVLSFNLGELGEIIISTDTAMKNSRYFGTSFEKEIILYVIHGILHLFGYKDGTPYEKKRMSKKENNILEKICAKSILSKVLTRR